MAYGMWGQAYKVTRVYEGGYVNHPKDPGGATNHGVTQRVYDAYRRRAGKAIQSVKAISQAEVADIYRRQYWDAVKGEIMPQGLDFVLFDGAINSGPVQSIKWMQRSLQTLGLYHGKIDGDIGQGTLDAIALVRDFDRLVGMICDRRLAFCQALKTWSTFGKGWSARIANVRRNGQVWATGSVGEPPAIMPSFLDGMNGKAEIEDAKPLPATSPADASAAVGGTVGTTAASALGYVEGAKDQLAGFAGTVPYISEVLVGLTVIGILGGAGAALWARHQRRKAKALSDALDLPTGVAA